MLNTYQEGNAFEIVFKRLGFVLHPILSSGGGCVIANSTANMLTFINTLSQPDWIYRNHSNGNKKFRLV